MSNKSSWSVVKYYRITRGLIIYKNRVPNFNKTFPQSPHSKVPCRINSRHFCRGAVVSSNQKSESNETANVSETFAVKKDQDTEDETSAVFPLDEEKRKALLSPLPSKYDAEYVESSWYAWWEKNNLFRPQKTAASVSDKGDKSENTGFMLCLPPPNVTGVLHLGHALTGSIQDAIVRWNRMSGRETLWNPGSDHAGISTQVVVEKKLFKDQRLTRHDLGRKLFLEELWKWKHEKGSKIYEQMRKLGASLDWSRDCFTLDPKLSKAVTEAFVRLYDEGLIYRRQRMVNWCPSLKSAISDVEVENLPLEGRTLFQLPGYKKKVEFGVIHSFAYPVDESDEEIVVATTRIETMLGDTAVAVHPRDSRYTHLHGKCVRHPLCGSRLPIICDEFVDREFGTGAVKITPAHDHNDHAVGERHGLPLLTVIDDGGQMTNVPDIFMGMNRFDARVKVISALKEKSLYHGCKENPMVLPLCSRTGDIIEPKLKEQWFVDCTDMAAQAIQAVKHKDLKIIPDDFEKHWFQWLENIRDWCISRQLWWGHRIPAYRVTSPQVGNDTWFVGRTEEEAKQRASMTLNIPANQITLQQDEDVLDTWFSSSLFPFSIFGWPEQSKDLERFYPNSMLETAHDILFFWVARMVMMGKKLTGQLPFSQVLLHGILRDSQGRKMSKSLGNVIDPMDVIHGTTLQNLWMQLEQGNLSQKEVKTARKSLQHEFPNGIPACGTDALRFTLCSYNFKNHYINMNVQHVMKNQRFCNKIWQAFRFFIDHLGDNYKPDANMELTGKETKMDLWILSRMTSMLETCDLSFSTFDLHNATAAIQQFWITELCDVYLEYSKMVFQSEDEAAIKIAKDTLYRCVDVTLRALSPFMPYLTEELYQRMPAGELDKSASVCIAPYPTPDQYNYRDLAVEAEVGVILDIVYQALQLRSLFNLTKQKASVYIVVDDNKTFAMLDQCVDALKVLSRSSSIDLLHGDCEAREGVLFSIPVQPGLSLHMQIQDVVEYDKAQKSLSQKKQQILKKMREAEKSSQDNESDDTVKKVKLLESELDIIHKALETIEDLR